MSRIIKFRVWDSVNKKYAYSDNKAWLIGLDGRLFDGHGCSYDENVGVGHTDSQILGNIFESPELLNK